jgi:hypothetical protein
MREKFGYFMKNKAQDEMMGWAAIWLGILLLVFVPPANKIFFGRFVLEDTFTKELLHICLISIGWLILNRASLVDKIKNVEKENESSGGVKEGKRGIE